MPALGRKQQAVLSFPQHIVELEQRGRLQNDGGTENATGHMKKVHKPATIRSAAVHAFDRD
jgi:hypothetical protein